MAEENPIRAALEPSNDAVLLRIKVVPGASRDRVVGMLGDRLKVSVSAAPEGGKANKAVCKLLAKTLKISPRDVSVSAGQTQPTKTIHIVGIDLDTSAQRLAQACCG